MNYTRVLQYFANHIACFCCLFLFDFYSIFKASFVSAIAPLMMKSSRTSSYECVLCWAQKKAKSKSVPFFFSFIWCYTLMSWTNYLHFFLFRGLEDSKYCFATQHARARAVNPYSYIFSYTTLNFRIFLLLLLLGLFCFFSPRLSILGSKHVKLSNILLFVQIFCLDSKLHCAISVPPGERKRMGPTIDWKTLWSSCVCSYAGYSVHVLFFHFFICTLLWILCFMFVCATGNVLCESELSFFLPQISTYLHRHTDVMTRHRACFTNLFMYLC